MENREISELLSSHLTAINNTQYDFNYEEREQEIAAVLFTIDEERRYNMIFDILVKQNPVIGMRVAEKCIIKEEYFENIMKFGFQIAGSAQVGFWVKCGLRHFESQRLVLFIFKVLAENPPLLDLAVYWLNAELPESESDARSILRQQIAIMRDQSQ